MGDVPGDGRVSGGSTEMDGVMALHPMVFGTLPDGSHATFQRLGVKVETLAAAQPIVEQHIARARRLGATAIRVDIFDDLACRSAWRGRIKA